MFESPSIISVKELIMHKKLKLPNYQRPYKWNVKKVLTLLSDIEYALHQNEKYSQFKYRIGTIIIHNNKSEGTLDIVDGQQRIVTIALILKVLNGTKIAQILTTQVTSKISKENIIQNFLAIKAYLSGISKTEKKRLLNAMISILEFVVVSTKHLSEAFQLFDSQNTRGKTLDPHDLLKAFHLRAMRNHPNEMKHTVEKWERTKPKDIHLLFRDYLFPIKCWRNREKGHPFTSADIDEYKGVSFDSHCSYAMRTVKGMPIFQVDEPFVAGNNFFEYVEHYLNILTDVNEAISKPALNLYLNGAGVGFSYARQLFICAVLYYYDRFRRFDERTIKYLYAWAFMVRLRMQNLGFDTIRNYAVGEDKNLTQLPMFYLLHKCMGESDILEYRIPMLAEDDIKYASKKDKDPLLNCVRNILGNTRV